MSSLLSIKDGLSIFIKHGYKSTGAEHDAFFVYVGPKITDEDDLAILKKLGWKPEGDGWKIFT